uniref:Uncharacterized protein n=1 Tax=Anguilla anguilla TaxID=7936 RepID=A0A0E9UY09_ANGAN
MTSIRAVPTLCA